MCEAEIEEINRGRDRPDHTICARVLAFPAAAVVHLCSPIRHGVRRRPTPLSLRFRMVHSDLSSLSRRRLEVQEKSATDCPTPQREHRDLAHFGS